MKGKRRIVFTGEAEQQARAHLLQDIRNGQEDICFGLWAPSTGAETQGAIIDEILLPQKGERNLYGGVSAEVHYTLRAARTAVQKKRGLVVMHSHPSPGWQNLSTADRNTEGNNIAWTALATKLPLIGMTIGEDGHWSGRFWEAPRRGKGRTSAWCRSVQITGTKNGRIWFNPNISPIPQRQRQLLRTYDSWGSEAQASLARTRVGIIGLGSVGCVVAESMARIGVQEITLIDHDRIEEHNLDRLIYGEKRLIGKPKVKVAKKRMRRSSTAHRPKIKTIKFGIHEQAAYKAAIDCDILFSCVDLPKPRNILNHIATAHAIPLFDGGVRINTNEKTGEVKTANWVAQLVAPNRRCLLCSQQYTMSLLSADIGGELAKPTYIQNLPSGHALRNENVFPFALAAAAMQVNLMIRYLVGPAGWPEAAWQCHEMQVANTSSKSEDCHPNCMFRDTRARGDLADLPMGLET